MPQMTKMAGEGRGRQHLLEPQRQRRQHLFSSRHMARPHPPTCSTQAGEQAGQRHILACPKSCFLQTLNEGNLVSECPKKWSIHSTGTSHEGKISLYVMKTPSCLGPFSKNLTDKCKGSIPEVSPPPHLQQPGMWVLPLQWTGYEHPREPAPG